MCAIAKQTCGLLLSKIEMNQQAIRNETGWEGIALHNEESQQLLLLGSAIACVIPGNEGSVHTSFK